MRDELVALDCSFIGVGGSTIDQLPDVDRAVAELGGWKACAPDTLPPAALKRDMKPLLPMLAVLPP